MLNLLIKKLQKTRYFILYSLIAVAFIIFVFSYKNSNISSGSKKNYPLIEHQDIQNLKKFLLGKIISPFINVNYEIKNLNERVGCK